MFLKENYGVDLQLRYVFRSVQRLKNYYITLDEDTFGLNIHDNI